MQLCKLTVVALFAAVTTCRSEIVIPTSKLDKSSATLVDDLVKIVTSCDKGRLNGIGFGGNLPDSLYRTLTVQHSIPGALVDSINNWKDDPPTVPPRFRHKLDIFIIGGSTPKQFGILAGINIRYSIWWHHMASVFILDLSPGCVNTASNYLFIASQLDLLNAKVLCRDHKRGTIIFNYNPFTSQAPVPWKRTEVFPGILTHPFTVFSREYQENETMHCSSLDFDKVNDLGGYKIISAGDPFNDSGLNPKTEPAAYEFHLIYTNFFNNILRTLNGNLYLYSSKIASQRNEDMRARPTSLKFMPDGSPPSTTYPHGQVKVVIISQFRGYRTQLDKILSVVDIDSKYGLAVVYLLTMIFFKFFVRQNFVLTLLDLVRITCNTGFRSIPINTASRIYLTGVLFCVVTIQGIFQGELASRLTQNMPVRNINTESDLVDWGIMKICAHEVFQDRITHPVLINRYIVEEHPSICLKMVHNDWLAAYIAYATGSALDVVRKCNLHMNVDEPFVVTYSAFAIRPNFPLEERINSIISRMVESCLIQPWDVMTSPVQLSKYRIDKEVNTDKVIKKLELHELKFAFVILGIGLAFATIVLIIELAIGYECAITCRRRHIRKLTCNPKVK